MLDYVVQVTKDATRISPEDHERLRHRVHQGIRIVEHTLDLIVRVREERIAFLEGLRELGYVDGHSITVQYRAAAGNLELLPDLAAELIGLNVALIVVTGFQAVQATKQATRTVPIVMVAAVDPVATGLVASLARPGGNVTGLTNNAPESNGKRLQLV